MLIPPEKNDNALSMHILSNSRSLYSTRRLFEEAFKRGHKVKVYPPAELSVFLDRNTLDIYFQNQKIQKPDCIIPRLGQKKPEYTLSIIRQYEMLHSATLNNSQAMARSRDKFRSMQILTQSRIAVPKTFYLDALEDIDMAIELAGGAPLILKLPTGSQGMGVMLAETRASARSILDTLLNQGQQVMVQEFIAEAKGSDIRAIVLGGKLITAMRRSAINDDFRSNIHRGGTSEITELTIESKRAVQLAARVLGLQFAGVDLIESKRGPLILEVNSSPGLEGIEGATGVNVALHCVQYLEKLNRLRSLRDQIGY
jgi:ribosomal protein S6--L-glutamate ligase